MFHCSMKVMREHFVAFISGESLLWCRLSCGCLQGPGNKRQQNKTSKSVSVALAESEGASLKCVSDNFSWKEAVDKSCDLLIGNRCSAPKPQFLIATMWHAFIFCVYCALTYSNLCAHYYRPLFSLAFDHADNNFMEPVRPEATRADFTPDNQRST